MNNTINYSPSESIVRHPYQQQQPTIQIQPIKTLTTIGKRFASQLTCIIVAIQIIVVIPRDTQEQWMHHSLLPMLPCLLK